MDESIIIQAATSQISQATVIAILATPTPSSLLRDTLTPVPPAGSRIVLDPATKRATFRPAADLTAGIAYRTTITAGVKDQTGNVLTRDHTWDFMVA
jgi:hypothetical protein